MAELLWGTHGKYGEMKLTWKPLKDLVTDHLIAILTTQEVDNEYRVAIGKVLESRGYSWIAPKRFTRWDLFHLRHLYHLSSKQIHDKWPGEMSQAEKDTQATAWKLFKDTLTQYVEGEVCRY